MRFSFRLNEANCAEKFSPSLKIFDRNQNLEKNYSKKHMHAPMTSRWTVTQFKTFAEKFKFARWYRFFKKLPDCDIHHERESEREREETN